MTRFASRLPSQIPGFQQVAVGVTERDVGLPALREAGVRSALAEVSFEWAFAWTARVDAEIRHGQWHHRADTQLVVADAVFEGHPKLEQLLELVAREQRALFSTLYLHAVQRLLVLEAASRVEEGPGDRRRLQDALLGICNVATPPSSRRGGYDRDALVASTTRTGVANATEDMASSISRAYALYHELPRRSGAAAVPNYYAPEHWEPDAARALTVHERFMVGMAIMGNVGVGAEGELPLHASFVRSDYFDLLADELQAGDSRRLSDAVAGDRGFFRRLFDRETPGLPGNATNSIPFQVRPLLALQGGGFLLSSTNALASWMTRGVHYACLTPLEGTPAAKAFLAYVGRLLETHAVELLQDAHRDQSDVRVLGEQSYDKGSSHTSDIAVVDGRDLVLIEVEAHRFTKEALLSGDTEQVLEELNKMIVAKARQVDDCIAALRRPVSPATLPGVDMSEIDRIWPVVVVEGGIVQSRLLWEYLDEQLAGMLDAPNVHALSVLTMDELEAIAGYVEHGHRVATLLRRWKFGSSRHVDFTYFCSVTTGLKQRRRSRLVERRWQRLSDEMNSAFSEEAQARLRGGRADGDG